ncbi:MAG: TolC family protein [Polyangiaceae bacterium]|nr:TolC family protein [Polyangiaceae bacterium]
MDARQWRRAAPGLLGLIWVTAAWAQKPPAPALRQVGPAASAAASAAGQASGAASAPVAAPSGSGSAGRVSTMEARIARLLPNGVGWNAEQVAQRARKVSYDVAAKNEALKAAAAKVDQALVNFIPRLSGTARYTRLSPITLPSLGGGGPPLIVASPGTAAPVGQPIPPGTPLVGVPLAFNFSFPVILDNYSLQASLAVPISDYFFRIAHGYAAASHSQDAARLDKIASEAKAGADAKVAFYNWVKASGQYEVLLQSQEAAREHGKDAEALFKAGLASKADVMAVQAQIAQGELAIAQASEYVQMAMEQLRLAVQAKPDETITLGEDVTQALPPLKLDAAALKQEAMNNRAELRALAAAELGLVRVTSINRAQAWPQLVAVGNVTYANPNQRFIPQTNQWNATWDVSLQLTWSPNDFFAGTAAGSESEANVAKLKAQRSQLQEGLHLEITQAILASQTADLAVETTRVAHDASEEAYRVRKEMYRVGKATSVELSDAEANLFRAKLAAVSARIDQRIARTRVDHATGRDLAR